MSEERDSWGRDIFDRQADERERREQVDEGDLSGYVKECTLADCARCRVTNCKTRSDGEELK